MPSREADLGGNDDQAAANALDALYHSAGGRPLVAYVFLACCYALTVPALLEPSIYDMFGGIAPRRYPWQLLTAVLLHGWPGFPAVIHLGLNTILILECGRPCERLVGPGRFFTLCILSALANAVVQVFLGGVNGSSLVIWSWGPTLFLALRWSNRRGGASMRAGSAYQRVSGILMVMYGIVTLAMAVVPYVAGYRGNPVFALVWGNSYHLTATAVGIAAAITWRGYIAERLESLAVGEIVWEPRRGRAGE